MSFDFGIVSDSIHAVLAQSATLIISDQEYLITGIITRNADNYKLIDGSNDLMTKVKVSYLEVSPDSVDLFVIDYPSAGDTLIIGDDSYKVNEVEPTASNAIRLYFS